MLKIEHVNFILASLQSPGLVVPVAEARMAVETLDALEATRTELAEAAALQAKLDAAAKLPQPVATSAAVVVEAPATTE